MSIEEKQDQLILKFLIKGLRIQDAIKMTEKELKMKTYTMIDGKYYLYEDSYQRPEKS